MSIFTQKTNCYNCGSWEYEHYDKENGFNLVRCKVCSLLYVNPRPSDSDIAEANKIGMHIGDKIINLRSSFNRSKIKHYLTILRDFYNSDTFMGDDVSWLDIGCGYGEFMQALRIYSKNRLKIKGTETNQVKIETARAHNLEVAFFDLDTHNDKYNFISMLNVYSHLPNPVQTLNTCKKMLKSGGEILLETSHSSHLPSRDHHKPYYLPDHLSFANREIVVNILERIGFEIINIEFYRLFPKLGPISLMKELAKIVLDRGGNIRNFFYKYPNRDMWIRARLKGN